MTGPDQRKRMNGRYISIRCDNTQIFIQVMSVKREMIIIIVREERFKESGSLHRYLRLKSLK